MVLIRYILVIAVILYGCRTMAQNSMPEWSQQRFESFSEVFRISDYPEPSYLEADFSGGGEIDVAILVQHVQTKRIGIIIFFKEDDMFFLAGAGNSLGNAGSDFRWADTWSVLSEQVTYTMTFKEDGDVDGTKEVKLERPAIKIREEEGSGGLIYFNGTKFVWIHQGD